LGINATNGFRGNVLDYHLNGGTSVFSVDSTGALTASNGATFGGSTSVQGSITSSSGGTGSNIISKTTTTASSSTCASPGSYQWLQQVWHGGANTTNTLSMTPTCTGGTDGATKVTVANSNTASPLTWAVSGNVTSQGYGNTQGATIAIGAAAGTGATASCTTNHVCSMTSGTVTLTTTSNAPTTGAVLTITDLLTHANLPDCLGRMVSGSGPYAEFTSWAFSYGGTNNNVVTVNTNGALSTSTTYTITYQCFGN
jgi:hypothetical protein